MAEDAGTGRWKRWLATSALLVLALAHVAASEPANPPRGAPMGPALAKALEGPVPPEGLAIAVALRGTDMPTRGPERRAAVRARQQGVLDGLPAGGLRLRHRYRSLAGFAGWAGRATIEALSQRDEVELVYLDGRVRAALLQGVPLVGADTAHALGYTGEGVKVAVLDTGIDTDHPDLEDDLVAQHCFCDDQPSPLLGCCPGGDDEEENAEDDAGHGTSVSGIITSGGVSAPVGVAPDAQIVAVKVLDSNGEGNFSDVAAALDWVLTERDVAGGPVEGTRIVNLSFGDDVEHDDPGVSPCTGSNTANAIAALYGEGVAVFAASGNEGFDDGIAFPACVTQAISVGGVYDAALGTVEWCGDPECSTVLCTDSQTAADTFVCHSNSDEILDLLAPDWRTRSSTLGGGAGPFGGTSAASPYAAAQAALLFEADPSLTPADVRTLLKGNGPQVTNPDNGLSFTRSDGGAAVLQVAPAVCGNDVLETGEDCDDGNTDPGDCCSASCTYEASGSPCGNPGDGVCDLQDTCDGAGTCDDNVEPPTHVCRADAGDCDVEELCDGAGNCPADAFEASGSPCGNPGDGVCDLQDTCDGAGTCDDNVEPPTHVCRADAGECDVEELCDGAGDCPTDSFEPAGTWCGEPRQGFCDIQDKCDGAGVCEALIHPAGIVCRFAAGDCDIAEVCDGVDFDCPADALEPDTTECRPAADLCDYAEYCTGSDPDCPTDVVVECADGDVCNGEEVCVDGDCTDGTGLDCDDSDPCTADSCDAITGCDHAWICGTVVPATPAWGEALLVALLAAAGALLTGRRRRSTPARDPS